jgi:hypothetical protein
MNTARIVSELREALKREVRLCGLVLEPLPALPPPIDLDAESEILSAVLTGYVRTYELEPLARDHFYSHIHGAIWAAATEVVEPGDLDAIRQNLITMGWRGALEDELHLVRDATPWASLTRCRQLGQLLIELAKQRSLLERLKRIDIGLRTGELDRGSAQRLLSAEVAA